MPEGQYPGSIWMPTDQMWQGRSGHKPKWIIIHGTAWPGPATAQDIGRFFQHPNRPTSTHYIIDKAGTIVQCVREEDSAWGNGIVTAGHAPWWGKSGNPNLETISIEHVKWNGKTHNDEGLTGAQWEASFRLIWYLCNKWGIPKQIGDESGGVTGHFSIDPINRSYCPGPYPWNDLIQALNAPGAPPGMTQIAQLPGPYSGEQTAKPTTGNGTLQPAGLRLPGAASTQEQLADLPGFAGIVLRFDHAEQFSGFDSSKLGQSVTSNGTALLIRGAMIVTGVIIILLLFAALARGNAWIGDAGLDTLPLMRQTGSGQARIQAFNEG